ncbi:MAG: transposase [Myxococcota bacterium]
MPQARAEHLDVDSTPYYHCISRCVRRAFLCGRDRYTGRDFDHRKEWVEERLLALSKIYAIHVHAYAVMSNHLHVVVEVDRTRAEGWTEREVIRRMGKLFRYAPKSIEALRGRARDERIAEWRERLWSLSWMMRSLNENIARRANAEDECTGRFWEGRFKCQPLLDEGAVLACMAYVDLNPVRAGVCSSLSGSAFTSIASRLAQSKRARRTQADPTPEGLTPFADQVGPRSTRTTAPLSLEEYVALLEWTDDALRRGESNVVPILLEELQIAPGAWLATMASQGLRTVCVVGEPVAVDEFAAKRGKAWVKGAGWAKRFFR